jgi:hypothetical protein
MQHHLTITAQLAELHRRDLVREATEARRAPRRPHAGLRRRRTAA